MKAIIYFLFFLVITNNSFSQNSIVNLDLAKSQEGYERKTNKDGTISFYIKGQHFKTIKSPVTIQKAYFEKLKLIDINAFLQLSESIRRRHIDNEAKSGIIRIRSNSEIFETIIVYEILNEDYLCHAVNWIDEVWD